MLGSTSKIYLLYFLPSIEFFSQLAIIQNKGKIEFFSLSGEPGMGKTASVAMLAMKYATRSEELKKFDFVFTICLRNVDKYSSLAEIIIQQHDRLEAKDVPVKLVEDILRGRTKQKVLLILDGYDEYKPGTNTAIDRALSHTIGDCFILLTSRPGYVSKELTSKMTVVTIEGFSEDNISKCSAQYLDSKELSNAMIQQAKQTGLYDLLHIPIILLMTCLVFKATKRFLPETRTEIYGTILDTLINVTATKNKDPPSPAADEKTPFADTLVSLGKFSWEALQNDVQQLLLNKVKVINSKCTCFDCTESRHPS